MEFALNPTECVSFSLTEGLNISFVLSGAALEFALSDDEGLEFSLSENTGMEFTLDEAVGLEFEITSPTYIDVDTYDGEYEFTPTTETQTISTTNKAMTQDITINPIPNNYGLVTWDGSVLTIS